MKMNKKGFTLIELLAVIVILGLLMAIAIPSVTKYITQSRKKTLMNTVSNYMSALTNEVNNMDYTFTDSTKVYAVPVECIALERGGTNPFGAWYPASNLTYSSGTLTAAAWANQWAYVLVYYDDTTSSYTYGFTFKDSAGYGLYPMASTKMKEKGDDVTTSAGSALNTNKAAIQPTLTVTSAELLVVKLFSARIFLESTSVTTIFKSFSVAPRYSFTTLNCNSEHLLSNSKYALGFAIYILDRKNQIFLDLVFCYFSTLSSKCFIKHFFAKSVFTYANHFN